MQKKHIIIIIILLLILFLLGGLLLMRGGREGGEGGFGERLRQIFPFGVNPRDDSRDPFDDGIDRDGTQDDNDRDDGDGDGTDTVDGRVRERLRKITDYAISGYAPIVRTRETFIDDTDAEGNPLVRSVIQPEDHVRYARKDTGHIMETYLTDFDLFERQITNTEVLRAHETRFSGNRYETIFYRFATPGRQTIETFVGTIPEPEVLPYCLDTFNRTLDSESTEGADIEALGEVLNVILGTEDIPSVRFTPVLAEQLRAFQETSGLEQTSIFDEATRNRINEECALIRSRFEQSQNQIKQITLRALPTNILDMHVTADRQNVFYLQAGTSGGVAGIVTNSNATGSQTVFRSELSEWLSQILSGTQVSLATKASGFVEGYAYLLETTTGRFERLIGPRFGLTTNIDPEGRYVLFSETNARGFTLRLLNTETQNEQELSITTLPEKCTWESTGAFIYCAVPASIPAGVYPDDWYMGLVTFRDDLYRIDIETGNVRLETRLPNIEVINLQVAPSQNYLYFMDNITKELWSWNLIE